MVYMMPIKYIIILAFSQVDAIISGMLKRSLLSDHRKDAENLESRIGNCSTTGKQSSIAEELNRCYKNRDAYSSQRISRAFWPHWVYLMFDSYWLAQKAEE